MSNFDLYQDRLQDSRKISKNKQIDNKVKTFKRALASSYNAEEVVLNNSQSFLALVSGIPTNPKIGKKNFSTLKDNDCRVGDHIYWPTNETHWLITEHDSTEVAIFQGSMEKALYTLKWKDPVLDKIYSSRACVKGPDETTIGDGVKHSIQFDVMTKSLYLIVSARDEGAHLLKRYFELVIDGKKWTIQVDDPSTNEDLIYLQLLETSFNRDTDTEELADGKNLTTFASRSELDELLSIKLNSTIPFSPVLFRNDSTIKTERVKITTSNCTYSDNSLSFTELGLSSVTVNFQDYQKSFTWKLEVVEESQEEIAVIDIIGSSKIKTLTPSEYTLVNTINGEPIAETVDWIIPIEYFNIEEETDNFIKLKTKNKTGTVSIKCFVDGREIIKTVKIVPLFGGS